MQDQILRSESCAKRRVRWAVRRPVASQSMPTRIVAPQQRRPECRLWEENLFGCGSEVQVSDPWSFPLSSGYRFLDGLRLREHYTHAAEDQTINLNSSYVIPS